MCVYKFSQAAFIVMKLYFEGLCIMYRVFYVCAHIVLHKPLNKIHLNVYNAIAISIDVEAI